MDHQPYETVQLGRVPNPTRLYPRALTGMLTGTSRGARDATLPRREYRVSGVDVDAAQLAHYAEVCGSRLTDTLPVAYPHVLTFPVAMALMTSSDFPYALPGLVHLADRITRYRPLDAAERFHLRVYAEQPRPHRRGTVFDVVSEVHPVRAEGPVWTERSSYLHKGGQPGSAPDTATAPAAGSAEAHTAKDRDAAAGEPAAGEPAAGVARWHLPANTGRRYAAVSRDRNPIHMHPWAARAFGFPRAIAHGMWTFAHCLAALDGRLPDALDAQVEFRKPVLLPSTVLLHTSPDEGGGTGFTLTDRARRRQHIRGRVGPHGEVEPPGQEGRHSSGGGL